jgi:multidrug efflux pump subunit AcrA (membrane-fusion protein)
MLSAQPLAFTDLLGAIADLQTAAQQRELADTPALRAALEQLGQYWKATAMGWLPWDANPTRIADQPIAGRQIADEGVWVGQEHVVLRSAVEERMSEAGWAVVRGPEASLVPLSADRSGYLLQLHVHPDATHHVALFALLPTTLELPVRVSTLRDANRLGRLLRARIAADGADKPSEYGIEQVPHGARRALSDVARMLRFHESLDVQETAFRIANDGRHVLGCERISVLLRRGSHYRTAAVSGVATLDRRSALIRRLESLVAVTLTVGESFSYPASETFAPQLDDVLHQYLDISPTKSLRVIPLRVPSTSLEPQHGDLQPLGAVVLENYRQSRWQLGAELEHVWSDAAASALLNALTLEQIPAAIRFPFAATGTRLGAPNATWWKRLLFLGLAVGLFVAMCLPIPFHVSAQGTLEPVDRVGIFAPSHATVQSVMVRHGQRVGKDDVLAVLVSAELEQQHEALLGEIQLLQKQLDTLAPLRLDPAAQSDRSLGNRLAGDEQRLRQELVNLEQQRALLAEQLADLSLRSPFDGQVLTWDVERQLASRPVQRGQRLMTIADPDGPWHLELQLLDTDTSHLKRAMDSTPQSVEVTYFLASNPETPLTGQVAQVATFLDAPAEQTPSLQLSVNVDEQVLSSKVAGARVEARIECGRRARAYVWFRGLIDFVQARVIFPSEWLRS